MDQCWQGWHCANSTQAWFWSPHWQQLEREADEDFAAGFYMTFASADDLVAWLNADDVESGV